MNPPSPQIGRYDLQDFPNPMSMQMFCVDSREHPGWKEWNTRRERLLIKDPHVYVRWSEITTTVEGQLVYSVNPLFFGQTKPPTPCTSIPF